MVIMEGAPYFRLR